MRSGILTILACFEGVLAAPARVAGQPRMRAFDGLVAARKGTAPLAGASVAGVQHLLGSTGGLVAGMVKTGVAPGDIALSGKAYSEHRKVKADLRRRGVHVHRAGDLDALVRHVIARLRRGEGRVLVLDDGGQLIRRLHEKVPEDLLPRLAAVEQTRRGIEEISGLPLGFPVINVAESWAKLRFETPLIGSSVVVALERELARLASAGVAPRGKILLVGYGAVGSAIA